MLTRLRPPRIHPSFKKFSDLYFRERRKQIGRIVQLPGPHRLTATEAGEREARHE